ncbi:MAG: lysophospholipid acyltransferase family protein [Bacteroidales bacterium]|nr:lysophospholipid acyltransferase family protein [Bacteroidales bacterium]
MQKISFYIFLFFIRLISLLPFKILYIISDFIYFLLFYIIGYRKKVVFENLKNSFPDKGNKEIIKIAKKFYRHLSDIFIETFKLTQISKKEISRRVKFKNLEIIDKYYKQSKSIIIVFGHYGNWELTFHFPLFSNYKSLPVYKPLHNKSFDKFLYNIRSKFGAEPVSMNEIYKKIISYKKQGKLILTAFVTDQSPLKSEIQYWTKFLNQDTPVYLGVEKIAKKFDFPVIYLHMQKIKRGYYDIYFYELFENPSKTKQYEITNKHVKALEKEIIKDPQYWMWSHRRWKHKKDVTVHKLNK